MEEADSAATRTASIDIQDQDEAVSRLSLVIQGGREADCGPQPDAAAEAQAEASTTVLSTASTVSTPEQALQACDQKGACSKKVRDHTTGIAGSGGAGGSKGKGKGTGKGKSPKPFRKFFRVLPNGEMKAIPVGLMLTHRDTTMERVYERIMRELKMWVSILWHPVHVCSICLM